MKQYIITIIGAAVLCGAAHILTPVNWVKYVKILTGLVILSVIASPLAEIKNINLFSDFNIPETEINENLQIDTISTELEKRINQDIEDRIQNEFFCESNADATIHVNENNEITGVSHIKIVTKANPERVTKRLCEVYGITEDGVEIYEPKRIQKNIKKQE